MDFSGCTLLIGPCGTGKTTAYNILAKAVGMGYSPELEQQQGHKQPNDTTAAVSSGSSLPLPLNDHAATLSSSKRDFFYTTRRLSNEENQAVSIRLVLPKALSTTQLYGSAFTENRKDAPSSILGRLIREAQDLYSMSVNAKHKISTVISGKEVEDKWSPKQLWIVFDGPFEARWAENLVQVSQHWSVARTTTGQSRPCALLPFQNGEFMTFPPNLRFLFESISLDTASPPLIFGSGIVHFEVSASSALNGPEDEPPIHVAFLRSFFSQLKKEIQEMKTRLCGLGEQVTLALDTIEHRVLDTDLLERILRLTEEYETPILLSRLHRVQSFASLLRSTLSSVVNTENHMTPPTLTKRLMAQSNSDTESKLLQAISTRMAMGLSYSLVWGLAMCTNDSTHLQVLISSTVKSAIPEAAIAWSGISQDVNLYETIVDFETCQFVAIDDKFVDRVICSSRHNSDEGFSNQNIRQSGGFGSFSPAPPSQVFIPTRSSIAIHTSLKAGLRTGQMVLLVGHDSSRRTTLLQNFMQQTVSANPLKYANDLATFPKEHKSEEQTLESVNRIRFHQVSLVMVLASRFRRENEKGAPTVNVADYASALTQTYVAKDCNTFPPTSSMLMAEAVQRLDSKEVIPFYFGVTQHDKGATEIAKCMERMLQRERTDVFEPPPGKAALLIIDDLHLNCENTNDQHLDHNLQPQDHAVPHCCEFLRSASEHGTVFVEASGSPVRINNLLMLGSTTVSALKYHHARMGNDISARTSDEFQKLVQRCILCLAPRCSSPELCSIFSALVSARFDRVSGDLVSRLPASVKHELPVVVAATVVLWETLRKEQLSNLQEVLPRFSLHDLARVFDGVCRVDAAVIEDPETLIRLWTHECARTFEDQLVGGSTEKDQSYIANQILATKEAIAQAKQLAVRPPPSQEHAKTTEVSIGGPIRAEAYLSLILSEIVSTVTPAPPQQSTPQKVVSTIRRARVSDTALSPTLTSNIALWSFAPEVIFFDRRPASPSRERPKLMVRRSSRLLLREASFELGSRLRLNISPSGGWIYAELVNGDTLSHEAIEDAVQKYFGWITSASCTLPNVASSSSRWSALPPDTNFLPVPFELAYTIARIERVKGRAPTRVVLLGSPESGRESLLSCVNLSWQPHHRHRMITFTGFRNDSCPSSETVMVTKWHLLLAEIYEHVGMNCESVTLVVKNLEWVPSRVISQLLSLMSTGDVTSAFSIDEQIRMATRLRDERLLEIEASHTARVMQIQSSMKSKREQEYEAARKEEREAQQVLPPQFFEELEKKYNDLLSSQLAQARLRYHQETDDFVRRREVETESITATIMSLMRPLGITSGKWQQIVDRIRKRLAVVVLADRSSESLLRMSNPQIFSMCTVIGIPPLSFESLRVLAYGHLIAEIQPILCTIVNTVPTNTDYSPPLTVALASVKPLIWALAGMATDMHIAVTQTCHKVGDSSVRETKMVWSMLSRFAKLLVARSRDIGSSEAKHRRFITAIERMESALDRLRGSDIDLPEQIAVVATEIEKLKTKATEQNDDAQRIREIMVRFQDAAEEQVRITNEMQDQAQKELQVPIACVEEANKSLMLLDKRHIVEIKSFTSPPLLVHLVLDAICVLFRYDPTWENARKVLSDPNVVQTLLTFDKDAVPVDVLQKLERDYLSDDRFNRLDVEKQSVAASMMVIWVRSIHQYASARLLVKPTLDKLERAQSRLKLLMQEFQVSKDRVTEAEVMWKATRAQIDALEQQKQELVARSESRITRLESAQLAIEFVEEDRKLTGALLEDIQIEKEMSLAWWNSLLNAGALTYTGLLPYSQRTQVFRQWQECYERWANAIDAEGSLVRFRLIPSLCLFPSSAWVTEEFLSEGIDDQDAMNLFASCNVDLTSHIELMDISGACISSRRLHDAFLLSIFAATSNLCTVLVTHYDDEMDTLINRCVCGVWCWSNFKKIQARSADFDEVLESAVRHGHQLLVVGISPSDMLPLDDRVGLKAIWDWQVEDIEGYQHLVLSTPVWSDTHMGERLDSDDDKGGAERRTVPIHPNFRLVLASQLGPAAFVDSADHITMLNATLEPDEVGDAALDEQWFQAREARQSHEQEAEGLGNALSYTVSILNDVAAKHERLVGLVEEAAAAGDFQVALMEQVRAQCNQTKEARLARQRALADVQRHVASLRSAKAKGE